MSENENNEEKLDTVSLEDESEQEDIQLEQPEQPAIEGEKADEAEPDGSEKEPQTKPFANALEWAGSLVYAVLAMLALNLFVFRSITVDGRSMNNTLQDQDRVISTNFLYTPQRGDIVVIQADKIQNYSTGKYGEPIIKRVIALAGDTIKFDFEEGKVYLKKAGESEFELLEEDYIAEPTVNSLDRHSGEEHTVPENCVFVMGDNRNNSLDSRSLTVGDVDTDLIMGKAFVRLYPFDKISWL